MKKTILPILAAAMLTVTAFAQSYMSNPDYRPHARMVIPVQQQAEFSGTVETVATNTVFNLAGWTTNTTEFTTVSNGVVSVTNMVPSFAAVDLVATNTAPWANTNTAPFCEFVLWAVDEETGSILCVFTSID